MKHTMQKTLGAVAAAAALALFSCAAFAQSASADGEIRKIDAKAGRVIIKHGEWKGMDMQAMTMAFRVRDAAVLSGLKVADTVRFVIEKDGGDYVVTAIERKAQVQAQAQAVTGTGTGAAVAEHAHGHAHMHAHTTESRR
jgi:Cu/Ag efflux protein CusF